MWDERERLGRGVVKVLAWAVIAVGLTSATSSSVLRSPAIVLAYLQFLGVLAYLILARALVMGGFMGVVWVVLAISDRATAWLSFRRERDA
ncbi:MAG: hypothetical protein P4L84_28835 [Isosphaeraceae bacterium]|nr:hypothetical protein [Isosphaeraceae bacterium]